jgi:hypothetical protein
VHVRGALVLIDAANPPKKDGPYKKRSMKSLSRIVVGTLLLLVSALLLILPGSLAYEGAIHPKATLNSPSGMSAFILMSAFLGGAGLVGGIWALSKSAAKYSAIAATSVFIVVACIAFVINETAAIDVVRRNF